MGDGSSTQFRLLGPVEFLANGKRVEIGASYRVAVLAALLYDAGMPVPQDELIRRVWDGPPPGARSSLYAHISRLRQLFAGQGVPVDLKRDAVGYVLCAPAGSVDLTRFRDLVKQSHDASRDEDRAALLGQALEYWRGPALSGLESLWAASVRETLTKQMLVASALRAQAQARLGAWTQVVTEVSDLLVAHPLSEPLAFELIRALYATGRKAEALDWYARTRQRLRAELGVEPGRELRDLHLGILNENVPMLRARESWTEVPKSPGIPVPAQLPAKLPDFVGRQAELDWLDSLRSGGLQAALVSGIGGVGKTSLVVQWAHEARDAFPDGQLFIDLRGFSDQPPLQPIEALARFLRALGVAAAHVPVETAEAAALYRSLLVGRKIIVVLDNAATADQARPLLPPTGPVALITSRNRLSGLIIRDGVRRLDLAVLVPEAAVTLLSGALKPEPRLDGATVADLAAACGRLPLALRIIAAILAERPAQQLSDYLTVLNSPDRIAAIAAPGDDQAALTATFDMSYRTLTPEACRAFCQLGVFPGTDFSAQLTEALLGASADETRHLLDQLVAANMIRYRDTGRLTFHDLLRSYARHRAGTDLADSERQEAIDRLCRHYLIIIDEAARLLYPQIFRLPLPNLSAKPRQTRFGSHREALAWLDAEFDNLVAVIQFTAERGPYELSWLLADSLRGYLSIRQPMVQWLAVATAGLSAATKGDAPAGQAAAHHSFAQAYHSSSKLTQATGHLHQALRLSNLADWWEGGTAALCNLGILAIDTGRLSDGIRFSSQALDANRHAGNRVGIAVNLNNLADLHLQLGDPHAAESLITEALGMYIEIGSPVGTAAAMTCLGAAHRDSGEISKALEEGRRGLAAHRDAGDRHGETVALTQLSLTYLAADRSSDAVATAEAAIQLSELLSDRRLEANAQNAIAAVRVSLGRDLEADTYYHSALAASTAVGAPYPQTVALLGLALVSERNSAFVEARELAGKALRLARRCGYRQLERAARQFLTLPEQSSPGRGCAPAVTASEGAAAAARLQARRPEPRR